MNCPVSLSKAHLDLQNHPNHLSFHHFSSTSYFRHSQFFCWFPSSYSNNWIASNIHSNTAKTIGARCSTRASCSWNTSSSCSEGWSSAPWSQKHHLLDWSRRLPNMQHSFSSNQYNLFWAAEADARDKERWSCRVCLLFPMAVGSGWDYLFTFICNSSSLGLPFDSFSWRIHINCFLKLIRPLLVINLISEL